MQGYVWMSYEKSPNKAEKDRESASAFPAKRPTWEHKPKLETFKTKQNCGGLRISP